jgi:hypothetical protein
VAVGGWEPLSPRPTGAGSGFFGAGRSGSRTSASAAKLQPVWLAAVAGRVYFRERRSEVLAANEVAVLSACDLKLECVLKLPASLPGVRLWPQCEPDVSSGAEAAATGADKVATAGVVADTSAAAGTTAATTAAAADAGAAATTAATTAGSGTAATAGDAAAAAAPAVKVFGAPDAAADAAIEEDDRFTFADATDLSHAWEPWLKTSPWSRTSSNEVLVPAGAPDMLTITLSEEAALDQIALEFEDGALDAICAMGSPFLDDNDPASADRYMWIVAGSSAPPTEITSPTSFPAQTNDSIIKRVRYTFTRSAVTMAAGGDLRLRIAITGRKKVLKVNRHCFPQVRSVIQLLVQQNTSCQPLMLCTCLVLVILNISRELRASSSGPLVSKHTV